MEISERRGLFHTLRHVGYKEISVSKGLFRTSRQVVYMVLACSFTDQPAHYQTNQFHLSRAYFLWPIVWLGRPASTDQLHVCTILPHMKSNPWSVVISGATAEHASHHANAAMYLVLAPHLYWPINTSLMGWSISRWSHWPPKTFPVTHFRLGQVGSSDQYGNRWTANNRRVHQGNKVGAVIKMWWTQDRKF